MGFALQSFVPVPWSSDPFGSIFPFLRFSTKPSGFVPALQRVRPTGEAVSLFASPGYSPRPGSLALLGFRASRAFPLESLCREHLPHDMPLSFLDGGYLTISTLMNLRGFRPSGSALSLTGCRPVWPFNRLRSPSLKKYDFLRAIFSPRRAKTPYETLNSSLSKKPSPS